MRRHSWLFLMLDWGLGCDGFRFRKGDHVYVSQWYILAALFWFPWLYVVAQVMIIWFPARGVVQSVLTAVRSQCIGALVYTYGTGDSLLPNTKGLGASDLLYYLSVLGFWALAIFYNWAGIHHLIGGPIPVWLISAGIVASVMMVIPVVVVGINHHMSVVGCARKYGAAQRYLCRFRSHLTPW